MFSRLLHYLRRTAMPSSDFHAITSDDAFERALAHSDEGPVVVYKHSTTCPVSSMARRRLAKLTEAGDPPVYEVVVQHARAVSHRIAEELGIRHESPQAIVLHQREPIFHASHGGVSADAIRQALAEGVS